MIDTKAYYYMKMEGKPYHLWENGRAYWCFDYYKDKMKVLDINGKTVVCEPDTFYLIPPEIRTEIQSSNGRPWTHASVTFYSDYEFMDRLKIPYMKPIKIENTKEFEQLLFDMQSRAIIDSPFNQETRNLYLRLILIYIHDLLHVAKGDYKVEAGDDLQSVRHIIMNSPGMPWTVEKMAGMANMSARTFQRKYKSLYGKTPIADLYDTRFSKSKRLLDTGYSISHILNSCGFKSPQHFSSFFKERSGMTPTQYKNRGSMKNFIAADNY